MNKQTRKILLDFIRILEGVPDDNFIQDSLFITFKDNEFTKIGDCGCIIFHGFDLLNWDVTEQYMDVEYLCGGDIYRIAVSNLDLTDDEKDFIFGSQDMIHDAARQMYITDVFDTKTQQDAINRINIILNLHK